MSQISGADLAGGSPATKSSSAQHCGKGSLGACFFKSARVSKENAEATEAPPQMLGLASDWATLWVRSLRRPSELGWVLSLLRQRSSGVWIWRTWSSGRSTDVCRDLGSQICWTTAETIRRKTSPQVGVLSIAEGLYESDFAA